MEITWDKQTSLTDRNDLKKVQCIKIKTSEHQHKEKIHKKEAAINIIKKIYNIGIQNDARNKMTTQYLELETYIKILKRRTKMNEETSDM